MGFSKETRLRALVAAARHCCVCHRYKGVKVEVHHIVSEIEGGSDEFDNAIVLCFDCHCDAGHYNTGHPRGSKFSVEELRAARDKWYKLVREKNIHPPSEPDYLYCRYLICKNWGILREITAGDLSKFPLKNPVLVNNSVLAFLRKVTAVHRESYRHAREWGESYRDENAYKEAYPDAVKVDKGLSGFPYFELVRTPSKSEVKKRIANLDGVTRLLLQAGIPIGEIATAMGYWEVCGEPCFQEVYRLRPVWGVFLAVTNISDRVIRLTSVEGNVWGKDIRDYRGFMEKKHEVVSEVTLPVSPLAQDMTVLIPIGTVLAPLNYIPEEVASSSSEAEGLENGSYQVLSHVYYSEDCVQEFHAWGPLIRPKRIKIEISSLPFYQELHELDLQNLYTIDRFWAAGCCPHLFFVHYPARRISYASELFTRKPGKLSYNNIEIPKDVNKIVIAELEQERTTVKCVSSQGKLLLEKFELVKDQTLELQVYSNSLVRISGFYVPSQKLKRSLMDPWGRNCLIGNFIAQRAK